MYMYSLKLECYEETLNGLTVSRKTPQNFAVRRKNDKFQPLVVKEVNSKKISSDKNGKI